MESQSLPDGKFQILLIAQTLLYFTDSLIVEEKDYIFRRLCSKRAFVTMESQFGKPNAYETASNNFEILFLSWEELNMLCILIMSHWNRSSDFLETDFCFTTHRHRETKTVREQLYRLRQRDARGVKDAVMQSYVDYIFIDTTYSSICIGRGVGCCRVDCVTFIISHYSPVTLSS